MDKSVEDAHERVTVVTQQLNSNFACDPEDA